MGSQGATSGNGAPPLSGSPRVLRQLNTNHVLRAVRAAGPMSRREIAKATGLSRPTVNEVVEDLLASGYVIESLGEDDERPRRPGPRARLVAFRADLGHVLGIDIGADKALVVVADLGGTVLATERLRTGGLPDTDAVLARVRAKIDDAMASASVERSSLRAVGVGTPGVVDPATGAISLAPQLPGWEGLRLAEALDPSLPCPVRVANEAHLAVLGERWRGAARDVDDAVYVQLGVGIGLGILIGGELYRGSLGAAGEIGYLALDGAPRGEPPRGFGAFEHAAGGAAFERLGRAAARRPDGAFLRELAGGDPDAVDAVTVFEAARRDDSAAVAIVDQLVGLLAQGIAAAVLVLNPSTIIIGGGLSRAGAALLDRFAARLAALVPVAPDVALSDLGDEAVAQGAIRLALTTVEEQMDALAAPRTG